MSDLQRLIVIYPKENDQRIDQILLPIIPLKDLQSLFNTKDDPLMYNFYDITEENYEFFLNYIDLDFDFEKYEYFLEY